jgi:hypothetical protein
MGFVVRRWIQRSAGSRNPGRFGQLRGLADEGPEALGALGALRVDRLEDVGSREARDDIREAFLELACIFTYRRVRAWC